MGGARLTPAPRTSENTVADRDPDDCNFGRRTILDFAAHRRIEHYGLITEQTGAIPPE